MLLAMAPAEAAPDAPAVFPLTGDAVAPNGAWSWFEDERAIVDDSDPANTLLLVSCVTAAADRNDPAAGDVVLLWRNLDTGEAGAVELRDRLQQDDHNSAALWMRPDGRYVAAYAAHHAEPKCYCRISSRPHDPTQWGPEQTIDVAARATYSNLHFLGDDAGGAGRLYNFTRTDNFDPNVHWSDDGGDTWQVGGKLLTSGDSGDRPYVKYASDGRRIHFIATEQHPRDFDNSVFHGYVEGGRLHDSFGRVVDEDVTDGAAAPPAALTPVLAAGTRVQEHDARRLWTVDLVLDAAGAPVAVLTGRADGSVDDHRFYYARFDGQAWRVHELAHAGGYLYGRERDYTGLAAIDPNDVNTVYVSTKLDPRSGNATPHYELYRGVTSDGGASWSWTAITSDSPVDNLRPIVPAWSGDETALLWLRGRYRSYTDWDTQVVGLLNP
ncbi:MAG: hypothetical protein CMJ58_23860 [Planctomycetaceae bacterium]|nr:hypothetical protein [Planctomycetaceae bacterium]